MLKNLFQIKKHSFEILIHKLKAYHLIIDLFLISSVNCSTLFYVIVDCWKKKKKKPNSLSLFDKVLNEHNYYMEGLRINSIKTIQFSHHYAVKLLIKSKLKLRTCVA